MSKQNQIGELLKNMNKSKQRILLYAEVNRKITKSLEECIVIIADELVKIYPDIDILNPEDSSLNWAYDISNAKNNTEVIDIIDRLGLLLNEKRQIGGELSNDETLQIKVKELQNYIEKLEDEIYELKRLNSSVDSIKICVSINT